MPRLEQPLFPLNFAHVHHVLVLFCPKKIGVKHEFGTNVAEHTDGVYFKGKVIILNRTVQLSILAIFLCC